jgi:hypothetical protein
MVLTGVPGKGQPGSFQPGESNSQSPVVIIRPDTGTAVSRTQHQGGASGASTKVGDAQTATRS